MRLLEGRRMENNEDDDDATAIIDQSTVETDVYNLKMMKSFLTRDAKTKEYVKDIFYYKSFRHIKKIIVEYDKGRRRKDKSIQNLIQRAFSFNNDIFKRIILYSENKAEYFAYVLLKCTKFGSTTDGSEELLMHIILRRHEVSF